MIRRASKSTSVEHMAKMVLDATIRSRISNPYLFSWKANKIHKSKLVIDVEEFCGLDEDGDDHTNTETLCLAELHGHEDDHNMILHSVTHARALAQSVLDLQRELQELKNEKEAKIVAQQDFISAGKEFKSTTILANIKNVMVRQDIHLGDKARLVTEILENG